MAPKKKGVAGLPGVLSESAFNDDPDLWTVPGDVPPPVGQTPPGGDTGQAPTVPEDVPPASGDPVDAPKKLKPVPPPVVEPAQPDVPFQFDVADARPLSLPGSQASSYARLGGAAGMRPYRTPNFLAMSGGPAMDIFQGPAGMKPLTDEELASEMGRAFMQRRRGGGY